MLCLIDLNRYQNYATTSSGIIMLHVKSIMEQRDSYSAQAVVLSDHKRCSQAVMTGETFMITSVACSATEKRYHHYLDTKAAFTLLKQFAAC